MATPHNKNYHPSFPTLPVTLQTDQEQLGPFPALLDSGADGTLVPLALLVQMEAPEGGDVTLRTHFGDTQHLKRFLIALKVADFVLPGVYVIADTVGDDIILGRDVLNKLPLFLDGPEQVTDLLDDAAVKRLRARRA
jgi:hypothetical protein